MNLLRLRQCECESRNVHEERKRTEAKARTKRARTKTARRQTQARRAQRQKFKVHNVYVTIA